MNTIQVELYDLSITDRKDDRFGRVVTTKSLNEADIVNLAVAKRTDLNPITLKASLDLLKEVVKEELQNGANISFGFAHFSLGVNGVFIGDNAQWEKEKHSLYAKATPNAELRNAIKNTSVNVRGMATNGTIINSVTDVASGEKNGKITAGGGLNIFGSRIKIEGDKPEVGLKLIHQGTKTETLIPKTSILVNTPSQLSVIVPTGLEAGEYKLVIGTQFSRANHLLKEPRIYEFEIPLTIV